MMLMAAPLVSRVAFGVTLKVTLASLLMVACASSRSDRPRASLLSLAKGAESSGPAIWRYYPSRPAEMYAELALARGQALHVGANGERWLTTPKRPPEAAPRLAGEPLVFAAQRREGWVFVGASGARYVSGSPLGEFSRVTAPPRALEVMSAGTAGIAGVDTQAKLVSLKLGADGSSEWVAAEVVGAREVDRFVDVELVGEREGYALSHPERMWMTSDAGRSWRLLDVPRVGAHALARGGEGVLVRGHHTDQLLVKGAVSQGRSTPPSVTHRVQGEVARGPRVSALEQRSAALIGERYFEIARPPGKRDWEFRSGTLGGELSVHPVSLPECSTVRLGAFGRRLVVACGARSGDPSQPIHFYESEDAGQEWRALEVEVVGRIAGLELAVGEAGALIVSGLCKEDASAAGCIPEGLHFLAEDEEGLKFRAAVTPGLRGRPLALGFSLDGQVAVAAGIRAKDARFAVFTSTDGGQSFRVEDISELPALAVRAAPPRVRLGAGEDATFGFSVAFGADLHTLVTDLEGRPLMTSAAAPASTQALSVAGSRGLAHGRGEVWETQDGGAEWRSLGSLPGRLCEGGSCDPNVACSVAGCVVGDFLTRSGWGIPSEELPIQPRVGAAPSRVRRLRTPLVCTLSEPAERALPRLTSPPSVESAALGADAWWSVVLDQATGAVTLHRGGLSGRASRVDSTPLLPPLKSTAGYSTAHGLSRSGAAAARYIPAPGGGLKQLEVAWYDAAEGKLRTRRIVELSGGPPVVGVTPPRGGSRAPGALVEPRDSSGASAGSGLGVLEGLAQSGGGLSALLSAEELGWLGGVSIGSGGGVSSGRAPSGSGGLGMGLAGVGLGSRVIVQPAPGGVFLQPPGEPAFFIDEVDSKVAFPGSRWSTSGSMGQLLGWVQSAKEDGQVALQLSVLEHAAVVVRDPRGTFDVMGLGGLNSRTANRKLEVSLTEHAGRASLQITRFDQRGAGGSILIPIAASLSGEPRVAPSQVALGVTPTRCRPADLTGSPRIVEPYLNGGRHPVIVLGDETERAFISDVVALHGTAAAPCVAALSAHSAEDSRDHALIYPHDLEHAWYFQSTAEGQPPGFEPRPMSCRFDASAAVPLPIYQQPGVSVEVE